jgi:hypothetical protein
MWKEDQLPGIHLQGLKGHCTKEKKHFYTSIIIYHILINAGLYK